MTLAQAKPFEDAHLSIATGRAINTILEALKQNRH